MMILNIDNLDSDWCDKDIIMLHACFQLLTDFVEKEKAFNGHIDWEIDQEATNAKAEIQQLYHWWSTRKTLDNLNSIDTLETEQYNEDNRMLSRLIKVRQWLWT
jgi:hypothetical protein